MFPMTVTIHNPHQLNAVMAALDPNGAFDVAERVALEQAVPEKTAKPDAVKPKKEAAKIEAKEEPKAEAQAAATAEQKPEALTQMTAGEAEKALDGIANRPAEAPTYQATADAVTKLAKAKGRDAAVAVLTKFGAAKLPEVKPEDFAAVIAACEEAGA